MQKEIFKESQWLREIKVVKRPFYKFYKPQFDIFIENEVGILVQLKQLKKFPLRLALLLSSNTIAKSIKALNLLTKKLRKKLICLKEDINIRLFKLMILFQNI